MNKVIGLLNFEPSYVNVAGLEDFRPISGTSILGRYRVCDFMLSNFTNSGIDAVKVYIKKQPRTIVEHIQKTNYNINYKHGFIHLLFGEDNFSNNDFYNVDIQAFNRYMEFIDTEQSSYVVIAPNHFIFRQDFSELLNYHIKSKNDITILYQKLNDTDKNFLMCDAFDIDKKDRITAFHKNRGKFKTNNISLETYVMDTLTFKNLVSEAIQVSSLFSLSDIIAEVCRVMKVGAYQHHGYCACISTLKAYYDCSMTLREEKELNKLMDNDWPIYTMTNDSCPTLYKDGADVKGSLVGNGCQIEGTVINSVIGRNVIIKKGAVIKDSVVLPDSLIDSNVKLSNVVIDRKALVSQIRELKGTKNEPIYVKRGDRI